MMEPHDILAALPSGMPESTFPARPSRKITDPAAMLREWAKGCHPSGGKPTRYIAYAEWLMMATPDQRHVAAINWNWNNGLEPLLYVIMQPDCDLATALDVFYLAEPNYYRKFDEPNGGGGNRDEGKYDLIKEIRLRVNARFYSRTEIAFNGVKMYEKFIPDAPLVDRSAFRVNLTGKTLPIGDFDNGIPVEVLKDLPNADWPDEAAT